MAKWVKKHGRRPEGAPMDSKKIRVIIADDHPVVRHGLGVLLRNQPDLHVVGEAADGQETLEMAGRLAPDVILMDLVMPGVDGIEATRKILEERPQVGILVLTSYGSDSKLFPALDAGALGFMMKDAGGDELVEAIRQVSRGQPAFSPAVTRRLLREFSDNSNGDAPGDPLTQREVEVLREIAHGLSNEEIAEKLFISPATVRTHVGNIFGKLNLARRTQAVLYALKHGIASLREGGD
jgi:NarL family two-component system response regulator LiaR